MVAATVASVLGQTHRDFELVIVDDGSTDGGMDALASFDDPRIRRLAQANAGPGAARNTGIRAARHHWIAFLDADDIWLPDHLAELDRIRVRYPHAGLIGTSFVRSGRSGILQPPGRNRQTIETIDYFGRTARGQWLLCSSSAAIPRSSYAALGGFGDALRGQDSEYWVRIALERPVAISNRVTAVYRLGTGGISDTAGRSGLGRELLQMSDLGPATALLVERYPTIHCPDVRSAVDRFIDSRFRLCLRHSAKIGDFQTLRVLPGICFRPPQFVDRLILALGRLPPPLARAIYGFGFMVKALPRFLKRGSRILERIPGRRQHWPTQLNLISSGHAD